MDAEDFAFPALQSSARPRARDEYVAPQGLFDDLEPQSVHFGTSGPLTPFTPAQLQQRAAFDAMGHGHRGALLHPEVQWALVDDVRVSLNGAASPLLPLQADALRTLQVEEAMRRCTAIQSGYWHGVDDLRAHAARLSALAAVDVVPKLVADEVFDRQCIYSDWLRMLLRSVQKATTSAIVLACLAHERAERARIASLENSARIVSVPVAERLHRRALSSTALQMLEDLSAAAHVGVSAAEVQSMERIGRAWWVTREREHRDAVVSLRMYATEKRVLQVDEWYWRYQWEKSEERERRVVHGAIAEAATAASAADIVKTQRIAALTIQRFLSRIHNQRLARNRVMSCTQRRCRDAFDAFAAELGLESQLC
jgi:hypothetical protein